MGDPSVHDKPAETLTPSEGASHQMLETWRSMAVAQQNALNALAKEIDGVAALMEDETSAATEAFQSLAQSLAEHDSTVSSKTQLDALVQHLQFQDQANQRLEQVKDTLAVMVGALQELDNQTKNRVPELNPDPTVDMEWLHTIISRYTLGEVRERFVESLLSEGILPEAVAAGVKGQRQKDHDGLANGDVELF